MCILLRLGMQRGMRFKQRQQIFFQHFVHSIARQGLGADMPMLRHFVWGQKQAGMFLQLLLQVNASGRRMVQHHYGSYAFQTHTVGQGQHGDFAYGRVGA